MVIAVIRKLIFLVFGYIVAVNGNAAVGGAVKSAQEPEESEEQLPTGERLLTDMSAKELRELGKDYGLTFKVGISKAEMVQAIEEAENELDAAQDNEPAPVFDASEAVQ